MTMNAASLSINSPMISISFSRMNEAKRKIERAQEEAWCEAESLSRAIGSLQVADGRLRMKAEALNSLRSRISRRQRGLQAMGAHIDYAVRRFQETDNLCAQRIKSNGYAYGRLIGLSTQYGIYGNIVSGLNSIIDRGKAAWDYIKTNGNRILDCVQTGLDIVGLIPGLGEIADGINAGICLLRGDYTGAALSLAAMIPIAGCAATAGKFIYKGVKAYKQGKNIVKAIDTVGDIYGIVKKAGNKGIQKIASTTGSLIENASRAFGKNPALAIEGAGAIRGSIPELGKTGITMLEETPIQKSFKEIYSVSGTEADKVTQLEAEAVANTERTAINGMSSFMDDIEILLSKESMDLPGFTRLRLTPSEMLSTEDILQLKRIRDSISIPDNETLLSKVITKSSRDNLLNNGQGSDTIGGYFSRAQDTKGLYTYNDYYSMLRLDYNPPGFDPVNDHFISVVRFKTDNTSAIKVPYGGVTNADLNVVAEATGIHKSELIQQSWPFSGNGFTVTETGKTVPEFVTRTGKYMELKKNASLYDIYKDGTEVLKAVYDGDGWVAFN